MDLNCRALGLLMESMENTKQAQAQVVHARQWFEDLLLVSSHHCECTHSRQHADNDSIDQITHEARDQYHRQAEYECRLRSNILTADEQLEIKPSPIGSIILGFCSMSTSFSHKFNGKTSSQDLRASVFIPRWTPPRYPGPHNPGRMEVNDWVHYTQQHPPPPPADGHDFLGAKPNGEGHAHSPPAETRYPGTTGTRDHVT